MLKLRLFAVRQIGFTLIEVMVAIAILTVVVALGAPTFAVWLQNVQVRTVAESIQNGLQLAHNEALRRNRHVEFTIVSDTGWTVKAKMPNADNTAIVDELVQQRPSREGSSANITITTTGSTTASFNGLGRVDNANPLTQVDVQSSVSGTKKLRVQLGSGGRIRMCDPDATNADDPRKCQ